MNDNFYNHKCMVGGIIFRYYTPENSGRKKPFNEGHRMGEERVFYVDFKILKPFIINLL